MKERGKVPKVQHEAETNGDSAAKLKWLDPSTSWEKEEILDVLYWIRQAIALFCGIIWGCIPLVGGFWIILFVILSSSAIFGYYKVFLRVDEEDFNGHATLLQEGIFTSAMLFLCNS